MPDLQVRHIIFTRVERAYSPRNTSGYQVVYHSPTLGAEVGQIERTLQCFETGREHERSQFFWTDRGHAVLTRSVSLLQPDPDVIDAGQRPAFLAHALVLSREEFENAYNDPFAIFEAAEDADLFASDEEQLVAYLQEKAPSEKLTTPRRTPARSGYLLEGWTAEELWKCFCLAWQAQALKQQSHSLLLLTDDQHELYNTLSVMLMLMPPEKRAICTFDTFVDGCYPTAGAFWALGSSKGRSHPGLKPVSLAEQRLDLKGGDDGFLDPKALRRTASSQEDFAGGVRHKIKSAWRANKRESRKQNGGRLLSDVRKSLYGPSNRFAVTTQEREGGR